MKSWIAIGDTHILMRLDSSRIVPEWHPVVQVTLRQVYEALPARWYVWTLVPGDFSDTLVGTFDDVEDAKKRADELTPA